MIEIRISLSARRVECANGSFDCYPITIFTKYYKASVP